METVADYGTAGNAWIVVATLMFLAIAALVVYRFARTMIKGPTQFTSAEPEEDAALRKLRYRYEHDEIDLDTYQRLRTDLERRR
ncbi:MAG: hypothetical protein ACK46X_00240 [Candidatus Sericytochromatia bacterium]